MLIDYNQKVSFKREAFHLFHFEGWNLMIKFSLTPSNQQCHVSTERKRKYVEWITIYND